MLELVTHSVSWHCLAVSVDANRGLFADATAFFASPILFVQLQLHIPLSPRWGGPVAESQCMVLNNPTNGSNYMQ